MNWFNIFDFIDYMFKNNHITSTEQIDFILLIPLEFSLSQTPKLQKEIKFFNKHIEKYPQKTQNELNDHY